MKNDKIKSIPLNYNLNRDNVYNLRKKHINILSINSSCYINKYIRKIKSEDLRGKHQKIIKMVKYIRNISELYLNDFDSSEKSNVDTDLIILDGNSNDNVDKTDKYRKRLYKILFKCVKNKELRVIWRFVKRIKFYFMNYEVNRIMSGMGGLTYE